MTEKKGVRSFVQGVASLAILWYILFGDPSRLPVEWLGTTPHHLLTTSSVAFLFWIAVLYFIEGTKAAERGSGKGMPSIVEGALKPYAVYWKICVPLTVIGGLFFCEPQNPPLYCPMFENFSLPKVVKAALALSNQMHEGAWLVLSLAICGLCAALYHRVKARRGAVPAVLVMLVGLAAQCVLFRYVISFTYHGALFPIGAIGGATCYTLGFLAAGVRPVAESAPVRGLAALNSNRAFMAVTKPFRYIGRNWVAFWLIQFYLAFYFYNVAASVYMTTLSAVGSYLVFLALTALLLVALEWGYRRLGDAIRRTKLTVPAVLLLLAVPFLLRLILETSVGSYAQFANVARQQWPIRAMVNVLAIFCLILAFRALTGHWLPAALTVTVLMTLLGIANHYTMKYHGALLTAEDVNNIGTAAGVINSYDLSVDDIAGKILLLEAAAVACCVVGWLCWRKLKGMFTRRQRWTNRLASLLAAFFGLYFCYFSAAPIIARQDNIWSWGSLYAKIGYFSGTVESTLANLEFSVYKPEGYSGERIAQLKQQAEQAGPTPVAQDQEQYPDIIMILNETWYNLDLYIDTNADVDYLANYKALDNAVKGYVGVPLTGGGTNGTEYEMLTANSMTLINAYAPFNRLNFNKTVSLPGYLKEMGYSAIAAHPHESQNYHRGMSWSQMGFDKCYFVQDFTDVEYYADRNHDHEITDTSALQNLIRFMDDMPEDGPRFAFLATMQNHGGWTTNQPEQAVVHSAPNTESEALVNKINEYLSCLTFTDAMIAYMQEYYTQLYQQTGRRVIVCMAGDHSPSFIPSLKSLCKWSDDAEAERKGKQTPYFIWANYPLDTESMDLGETDDMDLCCFMPTVLKAAGIPMSYYYSYISDMNREVASYTNVDSESSEEATNIAFYDRQGQLHHVDEDTPLAQTVRDYFCMEYNLNGDSHGPEAALFQPIGAATGEQ